MNEYLKIETVINQNVTLKQLILETIKLATKVQQKTYAVYEINQNQVISCIELIGSKNCFYIKMMIILA